MSAVQQLLDEREQLEREIESSKFMLERINETLREDQRLLDTHHAARVEIASTLAVKEALLEQVNDDLLALADAAEGEAARERV